MGEIKDGGPAFPLKGSKWDERLQADILHINEGMSLRDKFAEAALIGHLSNPKTTEHPAFDREGLVNECYLMADTMIARREKGPQDARSEGAGG